MDHTHEPKSTVDAPSDERKSYGLPWAPPSVHALKMVPNYGRRESLLTRQLHSETEHTDEETHLPLRTSRAHSTWSNPSVASTAELTSDDGHSVTSPSVSPPFPAAHPQRTLPLHVKTLEPAVKIVGHEDTAAAVPTSEKAVEAGLGRKRCITFACRGKQDSEAPAPQATTQVQVEPPPQKKCSIKFMCPTRPSMEGKSTERTAGRRATSPPPPIRRQSAGPKVQSGKTHRGSDSTVTHPSPKITRRTQSTVATTPTLLSTQPETKGHRRKYSTDSGESDNDDEAVRFHEFATSEDEPEGWVKEATCHRSRLTVSDTLRKENVIRKACEEVEEEAVEEEEEAEEELDAGLNEADEGEDDDVLDEDEDEDEDEESDDGFHSDDEEGFANSDEEDEDDSDLEWWRPGGVSTAATSIEHLDRLAIINSQQPASGSSVGSASSGRVSPRQQHRPRRSRKHGHSGAVPIQRSASPDLPDSTDFVCGTLDEDRPIEQAYINRRKIREAAKHKTCPQDFDPTFPTSDPEMDEEDDEDLMDAEESNVDGDFLHGELDEMHGKIPSRKPSVAGRHRSNSHRSPPPPARYHSPAPKKKSICRSPPPPAARGMARSPAPRNLFGHSPSRRLSPAPLTRMTSPPNSPTERNNPLAAAPHLGQRAQLTRTASLPRRGGLTISQLGRLHNTGDGGSDSDTTTVASSHHRRADAPQKRGAIDIVKGLDKKRQHRKEKLYQKLCAAKIAGKQGGGHPSGATKVKPGRGAERMKAIGLQLQNYHGKAEHILSL